MIQRAASMVASAGQSVLRQRPEAQGMAEYGLILAMVAMAAVVALTLFGSDVKTLLQSVDAAL